MPVTASRTASFRRLADDVDAALARGDEMGMELLKSLLPELCDAIEEVNEALREIDALLFEGLRDEAIGMHDADLAAVALRLHLEDKPQWPVAALFFESEGIKPPPPLDHAALGSLNSAYAELEGLRRPLDRLRRLALERAPLTNRISLLRKLRRHDSAKPVWGDQVATHEEARVLELGKAVKRAVAAQDAGALAALHDELGSPEWSIPVPGRLRQDTSGADVWLNLRQGLATLEHTATEIVREFGSRDAEGFDLSAGIERLRRLRDDWVQTETQCREWLSALPNRGAIAELTKGDRLASRLDALRRQVEDALGWLGDIDQRDDLLDRFRTDCRELEMLAELPPASGAEQTRWLSRIDQLQDDLQRLCQELPALKIPESLPVKVARAVADVHRRAARRTRARLLGIGAGVLVAASLLGVGASVTAARRTRADALAYVHGLVRAAELGEYDSRPELLEAYAARYRMDTAFLPLLANFDTHAGAERQRRSTFDESLARHERDLAEAQNLLDERERVGDGLNAWPSCIFDARARLDAARRVGGLPEKRANHARGASVSRDVTDVPSAARQRAAAEETRFAEREAEQGRIEHAYENAARDEFRRRLKEIADRIPEPEAPGAVDEARRLVKQINELVTLGKLSRSEHDQSPRVQSSSTSDKSSPLALAERYKDELEKLIREADY